MPTWLIVVLSIIGALAALWIFFDRRGVNVPATVYFVLLVTVLAPIKQKLDARRARRAART